MKSTAIVCFSALVLTAALVSGGQFYETPGFVPGPGPGSPSIVRSQTVNSAYGFPSYSTVSLRTGASGQRQGRYRIVPATNYDLPEQHSNLIRYIVLKEFHVAPNGTRSAINQGAGAIQSAGNVGGYGVPGDMEILKVEMPNSSEGNGASGAVRNSRPSPTPGTQAPLRSINTNQNNANGVSSGDNNSLEDDYNGQEDYDDYGDDIDNSVNSGPNGNTQSSGSSSSSNSLQSNSQASAGGVAPSAMQVVSAQGVSLSTRGQGQQQQQTGATEAFMFSDPSSGSSIEDNRRQSGNGNNNNVGGAGRNRVRNNRNRLRNNRNQNRVAAQANLNGVADINNLSPNQLSDALSLVSRYFAAQSQLLRQTGRDAGGIAGSLLAPLAGTFASSYTNTGFGNSAAGPYPASGQTVATDAASGTVSVSQGQGSASQTQASQSQSSQQQGQTSVGAGVQGQVSLGLQGQLLPSLTLLGNSGLDGSGAVTQQQGGFLQSTYGPPPGSAGFVSGNGIGNIIPQVAGVLIRPIQQIAGFKSAVINNVANTLQSAGRGETSLLIPSTTRAPVYGPPPSSIGLGGGLGGGVGGGVLGVVSGIKGAIVNTAVNKGRAAVGIVATKGRLASNTLQTKGNLVSKGLSQTLANKHDAFQSVIRHIQSIFNSNANLLNNPNANANW